MSEPTLTTVRIEGDLSITMSQQDRRRLLVRVLCELIASDEDDADGEDGLLARVSATLRAR